MFRQLTRALAEGGAAFAIQSCRHEATANAHWVGRRQGFGAIDHASDRLRSPTNAPPAWAAPMVSQYSGRQAAGVDGFAADLGDRVGVMRPIVMPPICECCHGASEHVSPAIRTVPADRYSRHAAIGFRTGEIR